MKFGIIVVLALFATAFAAHFLLADPGYVIINFRGYTVEMSVPVLIGIVLVLVFAIWVIRKIVLAPRRLGEAREGAVPGGPGLVVLKAQQRLQDAMGIAMVAAVSAVAK